MAPLISSGSFFFFGFSGIVVLFFSFISPFLFLVSLVCVWILVLPLNFFFSYKVAERESVAIGSRAGRETNCGGSVVVGTGVAENNSGGGGLPFVSGINSSGSGSTSSLSGFHRS